MASETILLADDEQVVRSVLRPMLEHGGYHVEEATNGHETVQLVRDTNPDLVILDLKMPDLNGYSVLLRIKSQASGDDIPIIVLSGEFVGDEYREHSEELGAIRHLEKPVGQQKLLRVVQEAIAERPG